jgi:DNA (cytosine-5)-methyltransferase 1
VFSCFACGGGSTMGYKLAGYEVLGCNEIDKKIIEVYKANHNPKFAFNEDIRTFRVRPDLPKELFELDILDGSPPCSSFSMAGNREKDWGKQKVFREGQSNQVLDDLFFEFIELGKRLQPKVIIAENVKGLIQGNAKLYVKKIFKAFDEAGYTTQLFLLNAATMGVPQKRERVFFIAQRKGLNLHKLKLEFNERPINSIEVLDNTNVKSYLSPLEREYYKKAKQGKFVGKFESNKKYKADSPANTVVASSVYYHPTIPRQITDSEYITIGSYPQDYNFLNVQPKYLIGMSVPPVMTARIANEVYLQWLSKTAEKQPKNGKAEPHTEQQAV